MTLQWEGENLAFTKAIVMPKHRQIRVWRIYGIWVILGKQCTLHIVLYLKRRAHAPFSHQNRTSVNILYDPTKCESVCDACSQFGSISPPRNSSALSGHWAKQWDTRAPLFQDNLPLISFHSPILSEYKSLHFKEEVDKVDGTSR